MAESVTVIVDRNLLDANPGHGLANVLHSFPYVGNHHITVLGITQ